MTWRPDAATIDEIPVEEGTMNTDPRRVVIAGAGVAGLETALALKELAPDLLSVEIVSPDTEFVYRPLSVAEPFSVGEVRRFPLSSLAQAAGATLRRHALSAVEPEAKIAVLDDGSELEYDVLVLALGARPQAAVSGALTFRGPDDGPALEALLERATAGELARLVFAVPAATTWPLPLYELALLTAEFLTDHGTRGVEVVLTTPEDRPLALFGPEASEAISELLAIRGIRLETDVVPVAFGAGALQLAGDRRLDADAVVALPALAGPELPGVPADHAGFVPTDEFGWVLGLTDVYAAGDMTQVAVKQGGIAAEQADAVATAIASDAGAPVRPTAFRPVLRGLLLTGMTPRFLRWEPGRGRSLVDTEPLWWPPAKIVGRYLTPFLAEHLGLDDLPSAPTTGVPVEVELEATPDRNWSPV
jgi:sulfide:quinone oxidoreductase